jgi:predicted alpha-1,6-mannanase (GH76 family)
VDEELFTSLNLTKNQAIELVQKLRSELNQTQVIEKLWNCKKGGSDAWKRARSQFKDLTGE